MRLTIMSTPRDAGVFLILSVNIRALKGLKIGDLRVTV